MRHSVKQLKLLRRILAEIQEKADYDDAILEVIYAYLFRASALPALPPDGSLRASLQYLQILREEDGLDSPDKILRYFQGRKKEAKAFVAKMMDRVDRNRFRGELNTVAAFWVPGTFARVGRTPLSCQ
ncbi:MAG: hypothetical protein P4L51_23510 [Puia sp.]|nr:hypothetical protein [Puia sp.]